MEKNKDLNYYRDNAEEDYIKTPISVLRYIDELEDANKYIKYNLGDKYRAFFRNRYELMYLIIKKKFLWFYINFNQDLGKFIPFVGENNTPHCESQRDFENFINSLAREKYSGQN